VFAKLIVVGVLDLVKVIFVQLPDERGKVGVFEHPRQDRFCEFVHVLDDKAVASGTPRNDMLEVGIFEHPKIMIRFVQSVALNRETASESILVELLHEIGGRRHGILGWIMSRRGGLGAARLRGFPMRKRMRLLFDWLRRSLDEVLSRDGLILPWEL